MTEKERGLFTGAAIEVAERVSIVVRELSRTVDSAALFVAIAPVVVQDALVYCDRFTQAALAEEQQLLMAKEANERLEEDVRLAEEQIAAAKFKAAGPW